VCGSAIATFISVAELKLQHLLTYSGSRETSFQPSTPSQSTVPATELFR